MGAAYVELLIRSTASVYMQGRAVMRAPTAFFLFSEEQREQTKAECIAAAEPGAKVSVATVAKAIGEKWRALTDAEKAAYQGKQIQRAAELAASAKADAETRAGLHSSCDMLPAFQWHAACHNVPEAQHMLPWQDLSFTIRCASMGFSKRVYVSVTIICKTTKQMVIGPTSAEQKGEQDASVSKTTPGAD